MSISNSGSRKILRNTADDGLIVNVPNGSLGDAVTSYTYINWANLNFFRGFLSFILQNTTIKIYGTADNDSVADANAQWDDVTMALTGSVSKVSSFQIIIDSDFSFSRIRIERITTNTTNSCAIRIKKTN